VMAWWRSGTRGTKRQSRTRLNIGHSWGGAHGGRNFRMIGGERRVVLIVIVLELFSVQLKFQSCLHVRKHLKLT